MWLGAYVEKELGRAHARLGRRVPRARRASGPADIDAMRAAHPGADFLIHPECGCSTRSWSTSPPATSTPRACTCSRPAGCSTTPRSTRAPAATAIMATETGMLHPLRMAAPDVDFIAANERASCRYMKMITLPKLRDCLRDLARRGQGRPRTLAERGARSRSSAWWRSAPSSGPAAAASPRRRRRRALMVMRRADVALRPAVAQESSSAPAGPARPRCRTCGRSQQGTAEMPAACGRCARRRGTSSA